MSWTDVPKVYKGVATVCGAMAIVLGFSFSTFQTISAAEQAQQAQALETRAARIDEIRRDIDDKRYQLLSTNLNEAQRRHLEAKIRELEGKISCIQAGRDNC